MSISDFFTLLSEKRLPEAGVCDDEIIVYVANLLERGAYRKGNPLFYADRLSDMMKMREKANNPIKRMILDKKTGDFALLTSGLFPGRFRRKDLYKNWGSEAYGRVYNYYKEHYEKSIASLYDILSECFGSCVEALNKMAEEDICLDRENNYEILSVPKDKESLENFMLDAIRRWKNSGNNVYKNIGLRCAIRLGIENPEQLFN